MNGGKFTRDDLVTLAMDIITKLIPYASSGQIDPTWQRDTIHTLAQITLNPGGKLDTTIQLRQRDKHAALIAACNTALKTFAMKDANSDQFMLRFRPTGLVRLIIELHELLGSREVNRDPSLVISVLAEIHGRLRLLARATEQRTQNAFSASRH